MKDNWPIVGRLVLATLCFLVVCARGNAEERLDIDTRTHVPPESRAQLKGQVGPFCGAYPGQVYDIILQHEKFAKPTALGKGPPAPRGVDIGDVAVLEDNGLLILGGPNETVDLDNLHIVFTPNVQGGYDAALGAPGLESPFGNAITLQDDDALEVAFSGGFTFSFYGAARTSVFINSDGNLTFNDSDVSTAPRGFRRFLELLPRIAPLFRDLNPAAGGQVFLKQLPDRMVVTWNGVPDFGVANSNTFQVILRSSGVVEFTYGLLDTETAVVGVSPGGTSSPFVEVDYSLALPLTGTSGAVVEIFEGTQLHADEMEVARAFYATHPDDFDFIVMFTSFAEDLSGAFAYSINVKNDTLGLGDVLGNGPASDLQDMTALFGSGGRLQNFLNMNTVAQYSDDPNANILLTNSSLDILAHETGHRWLAYPRFLDGAVESDLLLGRQLAHWNFFADTDASELEGNDWGVDQFGAFIVVGATSRYSLMDQYFMGFRRPDEVPPTFIITNTTNGAFTRNSAPNLEGRTGGVLKFVNMSQIVAANGLRQPGPSAAQRGFRQAFVLLIPQGSTPSSSDLTRLQNLMAPWPAFFATATSNQGAMDVSLTQDFPNVNPSAQAPAASWLALAVMTLLLLVLGIWWERVNMQA